MRRREEEEKKEWRDLLGHLLPLKKEDADLLVGRLPALHDGHDAERLLAGLQVRKGGGLRHWVEDGEGRGGRKGPKLPPTSERCP